MKSFGYRGIREFSRYAFDPEGLLSRRASMMTIFVWPVNFSLLRIFSTRALSDAEK
jgi:hypothetical protein